MLTMRTIARYAPFVVVLVPYLLYELSLQRSNVVVEASRFEIGWHVAPNLVEYLSLMVLPLTRQSTVVDVSGTLGVVIAAAHNVLALALLTLWAAVLVRGSAPLRFLVAWMIVSIVPYAFFTSKTTTRYLYLPSAAFTIALALLLAAVAERYRARREQRAWLRRAAAALLGGLLALQWVVVNVVIRQWYSDQVQQARGPYQSLVELARSLGW
jgi:hypothetical protein